MQPHGQREGYADVVEDPPLELVLIEQPRAAERLDHLRIETATSGTATAALACLRTAGLEATLAEQDLCCHVVQDTVSSPPGTFPPGRGSPTP